MAVKGSKKKKVITPAKKPKKRIANCIERDIGEVLDKNMGDYGYNINLFRSFPDIRDGLKPVARRVVFSMYGLGLSSGKPFRKVAAVVGDVLGRL